MVDTPQDRPGLYAIQIADGVVKFGQSKNLAQRLRTHLSTLRSYGITPLETAFVYVEDPVTAERDLFLRLQNAGVEKEGGSRETYRISWYSATDHLRYHERAPVRPTRGDFRLKLSEPGGSTHTALVGYNLVLNCADCGYSGTHLQNIKPYSSSASEDRLSVELTFSCEGCAFITRLAFHQHKGDTEIHVSSSLDSRSTWDIASRSWVVKPRLDDKLFCSICRNWMNDTGDGPSCGCYIGRRMCDVA